MHADSFTMSIFYVESELSQKWLLIINDECHRNILNC